MNSRYKNVVCVNTGQMKYWCGKIVHLGKCHYTSAFPLTDKGEKMAHEAVSALRVYVRSAYHLNALKPVIPDTLYISALKHITRKVGTVEISDTDYIGIVCRAVGFEFNTQRDITKVNNRTLADKTPRQVAQYMLFKYTPLTQKSISAAFSQERTTVINSIRVVEDRIETEPEFADSIKRITRSIEIMKKKHMRNRILNTN